MTEREEVKENFCPACIALPVAFAGAGAGVYGAKNGSKGGYRKRKKMMLYAGIVTVIASLIAYYYLKNCKSCKL